MIKDKNTLKTYFENGDFPSQNQFADLIDSLEHQNDANTGLDKQQLMVMINRIAVENGHIQYSSSNAEKTKILLDVAQQNAPNQVVEISDTENDLMVQYFIGDAPYTVSIKEFQGENLGASEYYSFNWYTDPNYTTQRLSGNNLPDIPPGFELGVIEQGNILYFEITKQDMRRQINIVHTNIKMANSTGTPIAYMAQSSYWGNPYTNGDSTTDHYDAWDNLYFLFKADMTNAAQPIVCNIYNNDNGLLLQTLRFEPGQNYQGLSSEPVNRVRNVRMECMQQ